jgi:arylsulfatase A-like enzyme
MDLFPTFGKLAGAKNPTDRVIDGKDIWPVLTENEDTPHDAFFYFKGNQLKAVRSGKWKLHFGKETGRASVYRGMGTSSPIMALYDLDADMGEKNNVLASHPEIVERLRSYTTSFEEELAENSRPAGWVKNPKTLTTREN